MALDDELLEADLEAGSGHEIQYDYSEPDFTEDGRDYWEHYHYVVEPGQVLLRIDKYLVDLLNIRLQLHFRVIGTARL